jgi:hypothetical protein
LSYGAAIQLGIIPQPFNALATLYKNGGKGAIFRLLHQSS